MIARCLAFGLFSLLLSACQAKPKAEPAETRQRDAVRIEVRQSTLTVNGKLLVLGDDLDNWIAAVPGTPRCKRTSSPAYCIWDELGITIGTNLSDLKKVDYMSVDLAVNPAFGGATAEHLPTGTFKGTLMLDGVQIAKDVRFGEIKGKVDRSRKLDCGVKACSSPTGTFNDFAQIYFRLDGGSDEATPLTFSISCLAESGCPPPRGRR